MTDLATTYMGLRLRNPLVASPSPLSYTLDGVRRLADGGVGAIVLFSLFEEQLREEAERNAELVDGPSESFPEALDYVPDIMKEDRGPRRYLSLIERAVSAVDVPVIASLNGVTPEGWTEYSRAVQDAGAAAIELNIYYLPGDPHASARDVEQRHIDVLSRVKSAVTVPVAVKLTPYFSSTGEIALRSPKQAPTRSSSSIVSCNPISTQNSSRSCPKSTSPVPLTAGSLGHGSPCCAESSASHSRPPRESKSQPTSPATCSQVPMW